MISFQSVVSGFVGSQILILFRKAYVNKKFPLSKIHEVKADLKRHIEFYEKITFIEDMYAGETVKYAIEKRGKTIPTGHVWLKAWNEKDYFEKKVLDVKQNYLKISLKN